MKKDEVLAAVYQTPTSAEEATTFATVDVMTNLGVYAWLLILMCFERVHVTFGYISLSIFQCLFHLQDVLYRMFLCSYLTVDRPYHL